MPQFFARDVMYATLDGAPDWQTMTANTVYNESRMSPDWLIHQQPGMSCQAHTDILKKFPRYILVSVIVSVILAMPFFYEKLGSCKTYVARPFKRLWRTVRRRKGADPSQEVPHQDDINTGISITSFLLSTIGSIIISLAAPCLTAISLWARHRGNVNLWVIIQQWATRPRAACFVFAVNAFIEWTKYFEGRPHGFVISASSAMIAEIPLSALSLGFLSSQIRRHKTQYPQDSPSFNFSLPVTMSFFTDIFDEMQEYASALRYIIYVQICITGVFAIICILLVVIDHYLGPGSRESKQDDQGNDSKYPLLPLIFLWLISIPICAFSYLLWRDFLTVTPDDCYCVEESVYIDIIYYSLPVFLGLWRAIPAAASKPRPKQKPAVSIGMSEGANSQDQKDIEQAQSVWECQSLVDNRCLEAQGELRRIKRSTTI